MLLICDRVILLSLVMFELRLKVSMFMCFVGIL